MIKKIIAAALLVAFVTAPTQATPWTWCTPSGICGWIPIHHP